MSDKIIAKIVKKIQMIFNFYKIFAKSYITMRKSRVLRIVWYIAHFEFLFFSRKNFLYFITPYINLLKIFYNLFFRCYIFYNFFSLF